MKNFCRLPVVLVALAVSDLAHAQGLVEGAMGAGIGGASELGAVAQPKATPAAILTVLQKQGYTEIGDLKPAQIGGQNALQATATAPGGVPVLLTIDPLTGKIISAAPR